MKYIIWILLLLAFGYSVWAASIGWNHSILDEHSFRQAQTALSAHYLYLGGPFFRYETPLLGAPWSIPFELPVYQWLVAKFSLISSIPLEQSGRFIGKVFFYLTLLPIWQILRHFQVSKQGRIVGLILYLVSPMYLFWSRAILIESAATFFSLAYFAFSLGSFSKSRPWIFLLLAALFGSLAGAVKVTTAFSFFLLTGLIFLLQCRRMPKNREETQKRIFEFVTIFILPGLASLLWIQFSDQVKNLNPIADFISSKSLQTWNFGTIDQRISHNTWNMFFRKTIHDAIGHRTTWLISLAFLPFISKKFRLLAIASMCAFLIAPMTFTNLHISHDYYWMANGIFLIFYLAFLIEGLLELKKPNFQFLRYALLATALVLSVREYISKFYYSQMLNNAGYSNLEKPIAEIVPENDAVIVLGADWYPALPYGYKRRSLMLRADTPVGSERFFAALSRIVEDGRRVRAVVYCKENDEREFLKLKKYYRLSNEPYYKSHCSVFKII